MDKRSTISIPPQDPTEAALKELVEAQALAPGGHAALMRMGDRIRKYTHPINGGYISTVFFPECVTPSRAPVKFDPPSTVFTSKQHTYISTDMIGRQAIVFFPKAVGGGPEVMMQWGNLSDQVQKGCLYTFEENYTEDAWGVPKMNLYDEIPTYYSNVRLLGSSLRLTYIGTAQNVSGMIVSAMIYGYQMSHESVTMVEDGLYVQHRMCQDGMRNIYLPRDMDDFKYMNLFNGQLGDYTQAICIYMNNLPPGAQRLRLDVIRHFQGIPLETIFPYVNVAREPYSEKTMEIAAIFHEKCPFLVTLSPAQVSSVYNTFKNVFHIWDKVLDSIETSNGDIISKITGKNLTNSENPIEELMHEIDLI